VAYFKPAIGRHPIFASVIDKFPHRGVFVEFGAYNGIEHNITPYLAERGWSGYYTEPIPESYRMCKDNYAKNKKIVVDRVAIGASDSWLKMHVSGLVSTGNDSFEKHTKQTGFKRFITGQEIKVRMTTLNKFLEKHSVPENFELLVVDVEGMEWEVFRNFDIKKWKPKAILVELHRKMFDWSGVGEEYKKTEAFLLESYKIGVKTTVDTLFYGR
jgi:FkbM family methyltransferase